MNGRQTDFSQQQQQHSKSSFQTGKSGIMVDPKYWTS
jgi:hypothetical protein